MQYGTMTNKIESGLVIAAITIAESRMAFPDQDAFSTQRLVAVKSSSSESNWATFPLRLVLDRGYGSYRRRSITSSQRAHLPSGPVTTFSPLGVLSADIRRAPFPFGSFDPKMECRVDDRVSTSWPGYSEGLEPQLAHWYRHPSAASN